VSSTAADATHQNKRVSFKPDVQEIINKLDMMPSNVPRNNNSQQKTRKYKDDVASRTRSKICGVKEKDHCLYWGYYLEFLP
jgi:hypothetical protein